MKQETLEPERLFYAPCRYGASRLLFRGPCKHLDQPYIAFVGGTAVYGKFIEKPFPSLVETALGRDCVNFGCVNGGIDAFVNDVTVMDICAKADLTVVQVMGANLLSNRFFTVHPRRNDRFVAASAALKAIYHEFDFTEFSFTRHLLGALHDKSTKRFELVVDELREAWKDRMRCLLDQVGEDVILLWFSVNEPSDQPWSDLPGQMQVDPLFITKGMIDQIRPLVKDVVVVQPSQNALRCGTDGMIYPASQRRAAQEMLGVDCHKEAAMALTPKIRDHPCAT